MAKKIIKGIIGIILMLVGIYFILFEMLALMGEHEVLLSGYNLYLFIFFITAGICLIYFGIKLLRIKLIMMRNGNEHAGQ